MYVALIVAVLLIQGAFETSLPCLCSCMGCLFLQQKWTNRDSFQNLEQKWQRQTADLWWACGGPMTIHIFRWSISAREEQFDLSHSAFLIVICGSGRLSTGFRIVASLKTCSQVNLLDIARHVLCELCWSLATSQGILRHLCWWFCVCCCILRKTFSCGSVGPSFWSKEGYTQSQPYT